jgi:glycosyltransferase involved in cell wall biosynthesis
MGRSKIFLKLHGSDANLLTTKSPVFRVARQRLLSSVHGIGLLSSEEKQNFLRAGVEEKRLFVVKNVVERSDNRPDPDFRKQLNLPAGSSLLLFIGRFIQAKGLLDAIRAAALLRDHGQQFVLLSLGDGPARREAEAEVERLNLWNYVRFFGYVAEARAASFYANSDVLIFPTYHDEGFPMVIFNAAAAGLPIVTTRIRAAADYLHEPENCLWVKPRDPEHLALKITELLGNGAVTARMSANNQQLAARFGAAIVAPEYLKVYEALYMRS